MVPATSNCVDMEKTQGHEDFIQFKLTRVANPHTVHGKQTAYKPIHIHYDCYSMMLFYIVTQHCNVISSSVLNIQIYRIVELLEKYL